MADLHGLRVAILATDGVEESELTEPARALGLAGAKVFIIAPRAVAERGRLQAFRHFDKGHTLPVDSALDQADPADYHALLLPGGALNADQLRADPRVQGFICAFEAENKPMAIICHAPWELISSGVCRGRRLTSYHTIRDDLINAGADWVDSECVVDGNWVSSRRPSDLPAFNARMLDLFAAAKQRMGLSASEAEPARERRPEAEAEAEPQAGREPEQPTASP